MESYSFIQVIVVAGVVAFLAMGLVMPIEARFGLRAASLTLRGTLGGFLAATAGALAYAVLGGEWASFANRFGIADLLQVLGFFGIFLFIVHTMASRHIAYKVRSYRKGGA